MNWEEDAYKEYLAVPSSLLKSILSPLLNRKDLARPDP
uniref:Uncharacterized protein n=1 Tax=Utricularia reniformis TaxID=192314 RepID=A0A1Y0B3F5_9LAMI|nr:hypothetical protein AEK19_MT1814 [Utricularia reniformis]ART31985.1 hypothetical protein AEK19_MT1814 [Utricularia reniformis]